jgi:DNA-binding GntR family transcriptional regulator
VQGKRNANGQSYDIHKAIRDRISLLRYPPGMALSENALAREFGVSRTPIRSVLQRLEFEGLIETKRGIGSIVTTVDLKRLKEVYALRSRLYEFLGDLSPIIRISNEELQFLDELRAQVDRLRNQYDPPELARLYNTFQDFMLGLITNEPLREVSELLYYQTARVWLQILPDLNWEQEVSSVVDEIDQVAAALRDGNVQRVGEIRRHFLDLNLSQMFGRVQQPPPAAPTEG